MSGTLHPVLPVIAQGTAAIESAFVSAGRGLSLGLAAFRSLTDTLNALGAELDGGGTVSASLGLGRMSDTLRGIAEHLPGDGQVLGELVVGNRGMRRRFDDLVGDMRMMVIVSRSARLEAVVSDEQRASLDEFSRTIDRQIGDVQRKIGTFVSEHAELMAVLDRGLRAHLAFDGTFRDKLVALAGELDGALRTITCRREASLAFMGEAAARAQSIARMAGMALVSLQVGDNTRQRLEHVHFALEQAELKAAGGAAEGATVDLLRHLAEAQLHDTVSTFDEEASSVLDSFTSLARETRVLVAAGRDTYGDAAEGGGSFMAEFRKRFAAALDIVAACEANRRTVEHAIGELRTMLDALHGTLTTLGETSEDLVIVAVNVGLKAMRLGSEGRGLVTIAGELKRLAGQIALHVEGLLSTFRTVRGHADHFGRGAGEDADRSAGLESEAVAILAGLAQGDARIDEALRVVGRTGRDFDATVVGAAQAFEDVVADTVRLTDAADHIARALDLGELDAVALAEATRAVDELMLPLYSMTQERAVHAAAMGSSPADATTPLLEDGFEDWAA